MWTINMGPRQGRVDVLLARVSGRTNVVVRGEMTRRVSIHTTSKTGRKSLFLFLIFEGVGRRGKSIVG